MKPIFKSLATATLAVSGWLGLAQTAAATDYTQYVNPLIGSQSEFAFSSGNTYPVIARPWGMNFWTPQTGKNGDGWQYSYNAHTIRGLKQTHQPSPWINDFGQFSLMPVTGELKFKEDDRQSWFSHKGEVAKPYYYSVYLADYDILAEMTPTDRAAMMRFTYPESEMSYVVVDAYDGGSDIKIDASRRRITGKTSRNSGGVPENFANYFIIEFDKPIEFAATFGAASQSDSLTLKEGSTEFAGQHAGGVIGFKTTRGEQVNFRVASSFISPAQAELNLRELGEKPDFEAIAAEGRDRWNEILGKIDIDDPDMDNKRMFYSCLYRSTLFPQKFYEINAKGDIVHYSPHNGKVLPGYMYTGTGLWDTFRALFPLLNVLYPSVNLEMQEGFLNSYRESGFIPEWSSPGHRGCMVGNNSASVLADAWFKGVRVADTATLWNSLMAATDAVHPTVSSSGRLGHEYYNKLGYVPTDVNIHESAARTLEYAYDDWCIYQLGRALGRPEAELKPFAERALNYRNLFDKETSLMRGRNADGSFQTPFSPLKWGDAFTEGNSWHYTWSVFHDPQGLINLMGGRKKFVAMLDSVFNVPPLYDDSYYGFPIHEIREMTVMNMGNYAHGNQPIQHMIYLYDWAGEPWKAQKRLRQVMTRFYTPTPDGYCGDEDNGQTSAWYVFSALGFYPVAPVTDQYALGSPLFRKATLHLENGKSFEVAAPGNSTENIYVEAVKLNGRPDPKNYITFGDIMSGGTLLFDMGPTPNTKRGTSPSDFPYSFSKPTTK